MGDRCHVTFHIGGTIHTKEALRDLCQAYVRQQKGYIEDEGDFVQSRLEIIEAHVAGEPWMCELDEVNYANTEELDQVLGDLKLVWTKENDAGGSYGPQLEMHGFEGGGYASFDLLSNGDPVLSFTDLHSIVADHDPAAAVTVIKSWLADAGRTAPAIVLEGEALESCATEIAKKALGVEAA